MSNGYFDAYTSLPRDQLARAEALNANFDALIVAFDRLPTQAQLLQNRITYAVDSGVANAYLVALDASIVAYAAGLDIKMKVGTGNTTASTLNVNSIGVKSIKRFDGTDVQAGDLPAAGVVHLVYDGTVFRLISTNASDVIVTEAAAAAAAASQISAAASASSASSSASSASASAASASASAASILGIATANVLTWIGSPTSAHLLAAMSDKTGTGNLVFAASPALSGSPTAPTQSSADSSTKLATTAFVNNFMGGVYPYGNFGGTGTGAVDTGISVNAGQPGLCMLAMCCLQNDVGNNTFSAIYMLRFHYDGNSAPAATQIALDAGATGFGGFTFGVSGSNTLTITSPGGNWRCDLQGTKFGA